MIAASKDVEGMSPANQGRVVYAPQPFYRKPQPGEPGYADWLEKSLGWPLPAPAPCTPSGAMMLIRSLKLDLYGKEAVVVGHSEIVGKPMALLLVAHFCTTTWCHIGTRDLAAHTRRADILCVGAGKAGLVKGDMVKPGAVVIDIGINRIPETGPDGKPVARREGPAEDEDGRRRGVRQGEGGGRLHHARARRRRADDRGDAAAQHRRGGEGAGEVKEIAAKRRKEGRRQSARQLIFLRFLASLRLNESIRRTGAFGGCRRRRRSGTR